MSSLTIDHRNRDHLNAGETLPQMVEALRALHPKDRPLTLVFVTDLEVAPSLADERTFNAGFVDGTSFAFRAGDARPFCTAVAHAESGTSVQVNTDLKLQTPGLIMDLRTRAVLAGLKSLAPLE